MGSLPQSVLKHSQLPSAVACCLQPATSRCESYGFQHRAAETLLKVEIPMWDFKSALPTADGKIKDFAAAPQGLRCVPSGGARKRSAVTLPSSDEEGGKTAGFDGRRDNVPAEFMQVLRNGFLSLSHRCAMPAPFSSRVLLAARDQPVRILRIPARRRQT